MENVCCKLQFFLLYIAVFLNVILILRALLLCIVINVGANKDILITLVILKAKKIVIKRMCQWTNRGQRPFGLLASSFMCRVFMSLPMELIWISVHTEWENIYVKVLTLCFVYVLEWFIHILLKKPRPSVLVQIIEF